MAYADFNFYTTVFYGDVLTEDNAAKWLQRASDAVDTLTFRRTEKSFPTDEGDALKVRKAVCAIAEALMLIDQQEKALSATVDTNGNIKAAAASISSGRESISFVNAANGSIYGKAAADRSERGKLLYGIAVQYLADVPDSEGVNLLYAGVG